MSETNKNPAAGKTKKVKRRRRWPALKKLQVIEESNLPNVTICSVARKYEISPNMLYRWRRLQKEGNLRAFEQGKEVVPVSLVKRFLDRIHSLEQALEKKKKEISILRSTKPVINDLAKYPHLKMAIKYNLLGNTDIWISEDGMGGQ